MRLLIALLMACSWMACDPGEQCPGATLCDGTCVDIDIDPANCGACGTACEAGLVCQDGGCALECVGGTSDCSGSCVNLTNDTNHCGACGNVCSDGQTCNEGQCTLNCGGATTDCGGLCVDVQTNDSNCGACGNACADGNVCVDGQCGLVCYGGTTACGDACVDLTTSSANCGACGSACPVGEVCSESQCGLNCGGGTTNCDGVCVNLTNDIDHCGACNQACQDGQICSASTCTDPDVVLIPSTDMGFHADFGDGHEADNEQLVVGAAFAPNQGYMSGFLVFDTSLMPDVVVSARLRLLMTNWQQMNDEFEVIEAWDVSTPINTLTSSGTTEAIVEDLRSGVSYGMRLLSAQGGLFYFDLNQAAVDMINNSTGLIAIGIGFATPANGAIQAIELAQHHGRNGIEVTGFSP